MQAQRATVVFVNAAEFTSPADRRKLTPAEAVAAFMRRVEGELEELRPLPAPRCHVCGPGNYCPDHGTFEPAADLETQDLVHDLTRSRRVMTRVIRKRIGRD